MPAPDIQVAFQGGGAKFIAMLPITEAFRICEDHGRVRVKAVAGTSAGAICAALLAARCDFPALRSYLVERGPSHVSKLLGDRIPRLMSFASASWKERLMLASPATSLFKSIIVDGDSLLNEAEFGIFLDEILRLCPDGQLPIDKLGKALSVVTTDMARSEGRVLTTGNLKEAIRDSCALPLAFRSFRHLSINHHVDGGLSDNLPVECLTRDERSPIFAVFPEETLDRRPVDNIFRYVLGLFAASIDNSVKRSRAMVSDAFQLAARAPFSTFDFAQAIQVLGDDDWYVRARSAAIDLITDFAQTYGRLETTQHARVDDTRDIRDYIKCVERLTGDYQNASEIKLARLTVRVHCDSVVADGTPLDRRPADSITKLSRIVAKSAGMKYFRSSLFFAENRPVPSIWQAINNTKQCDIPIRVLPLGTGAQGDGKSCLVEFLDADRHIDEGDEIDITDTLSRRDAMTMMNYTRQEYLSLTNPHAYDVGAAELVLMYPPALGKFVLEHDEERSNVDASKVGKPTSKAEFASNVTTLRISCEDVGPRQKFFCRIVPRPD